MKSVLFALLTLTFIHCGNPEQTAFVSHNEPNELDSALLALEADIENDEKLERAKEAYDREAVERKVSVPSFQPFQPAEPEFCDPNGDGVASIMDIWFIVQDFRGDESIAGSLDNDCNGDGVVNFEDIQLIVMQMRDA